MNEFIATLPHEFYIKHLLNEGNSYELVERTLEGYGLAVPTTDYIDELRPKKVDLPEVDDLSPILKLLHHPERDLIDALCVLYKGDVVRIHNELGEYDIKIQFQNLQLYQLFFWHHTAIESRIRWSKFMRTVEEPRDGEEFNYKNMLQLARMGETELLFWKLQRPKTFADKKKLLEDSVYDSAMKLRETMLMPTTLDTSRVAANYSQIMLGGIKQLQDLEGQTQYTEVLTTLREGLVDVVPRELNQRKRSDIVDKLAPTNEDKAKGALPKHELNPEDGPESHDHPETEEERAARRAAEEKALEEKRQKEAGKKAKS